MATPVCSYDKCPRLDGGKRRAFSGQKARRFVLFDRPYCSRECLRWGIYETLRMELDRTRRSKTDLKKSRLGSILIADGVISREQLEVALKLQQWSSYKPLGENLVELGYITKEQLTYYISQQERIPFVRAEQLHIDPELVVAIPPYIARLGGVLPYAFDPFSREMSLACQAPINKFACVSAGKVMGCEYLPFLLEKEMFRDLLGVYEKLFSKVHLYRHGETFSIRQSMEAFGVADSMLSILMLEDDELITLAMMNENIWVRVVVRGFTYHYLFPAAVTF